MTSIVLPYELWYEILREATFIPREFDVSATTFRHGLLSGSDEHHLREYRKMLPTRAAIVKVCRVWHHIGTEFLYGSVHFMSWSDTVGTMWGNMALFRKLLESRPEIGTWLSAFLFRTTRNTSLWPMFFACVLESPSFPPHL